MEQLDAILKLKKENGVIPGLKNAIYNLSEAQVLTMLETQEDIPREEKALGELRDAQTLGVGYAVTAGNILLADSVGLGKTVQTAGYLNYLRAKKAKEHPGKPFRFILFAEIKPQQQIQKELIRFMGSPVERIYATKKELTNFIEKYPSGVEALVAPHSIATNAVFYSYLNKHIQENGELYDAFIVDEGSIMGNHGSQTTQSFYQLGKLAKNRMVLNATPFEKRLLVLYNQLAFVDSKQLPTRTAFIDKYCVFDAKLKQQDLTSYKNESQFYDTIKWMYYGNTRKNLGSKIENSSVELHQAPLSKIQNYMYKRTQYYGLVNDCPTHLDPKVEFNDENVPKLGLLKKILKSIPTGEQILIFSHYKMSHEFLESYLTGAGYETRVLNGDTRKKKVDEYIDGFKDGSVQVLITNIQKSLNFGNCNYVIFYSFSTNPSKLIQMEGRVTRDFHVTNKHFHILTMKGKEHKTLVENTRKTLIDNKKFIEMDESVLTKFLLEQVV